MRIGITACPVPIAFKYSDWKRVVVVVVLVAQKMMNQNHQSLVGEAVGAIGHVLLTTEWFFIVSCHGVISGLIL